MATILMERRGIAYASTSHALLHVLELAYGVMLVAIAQDLGATLLVLGVLANVFGFAYGLTALPVGVLADRISETRLLAVCSIGMGLAAIVVSLAQGTVSLGVGLCVLGIALGIFHPVAAAFISRIATNTGLGFAYLGTGGNLGLALGPIVVGAIASGSSWRIAYAVFSVPCVILGLLFLRLPAPARSVSATAGARHFSDFKSLRPYLAPLVLVLVIGVLNGLIYRGVLTFLPTHLSENVHLSGVVGIDSVMLAGSFTSVALLFGVAGQFLGGYLSDRRSREMLALFATAVSVPALAAVWGYGGLLLLGSAAFFAFFHFMSQPVFNALIADYTPDLWRGRMYGVYFFCCFGVGSFSAGALGYVAETHGVEMVFLVCTAIGVLATLFTVLLVLKTRGRTAVDRTSEAA